MCFDDDDQSHPIEDELATLSYSDREDIKTVTWDTVKAETSKDEHMLQLIDQIHSTFPDDKSELPPSLLPYWTVRHNLHVVDGVVLMKDQVFVALWHT